MTVLEALCELSLGQTPIQYRNAEDPCLGHVSLYSMPACVAPILGGKSLTEFKYLIDSLTGLRRTRTLLCRMHDDLERVYEKRGA